jgi:hypothetical protein
MAGNFFRGTTVEQDGRWGKSDERLMAKMQQAGKFSSILNEKINMCVTFCPCSDLIN